MCLFIPESEVNSFQPPQYNQPPDCEHALAISVRLNCNNEGSCFLGKKGRKTQRCEFKKAHFSTFIVYVIPYSEFNVGSGEMTIS